MKNLGQRIGRLGEIVSKIERQLIIASLFIIVLIVFFGVLVRYTPITAKTLWTAELARLFLLWAAFLGAGVAEGAGGHFRLDLIDNVSRGKPQLFLQLFIKLVVLGSMGVLIWWSVIYAGVVSHSLTHVLRWPEVVRVVPLLVGSLVLVTHCLIGFIRILRRLLEGC